MKHEPTTGPDGLTTAERDALPAAERNREWLATMDAEAGRVRPECDRLDARNGLGDLLEPDPAKSSLPEDHGDRVAIAEYAQAVRADALERYQQEGVL